MKDFFDEFDKEIESLQALHPEDDIIDQHILLNEGQDGTTENIEKDRRVISVIKKGDKKRIEIPRQNTQNQADRRTKPEVKLNNKDDKNDRNNRHSGNRSRTRRDQTRTFVSKFPETKFYLPSLREGYTRYMPIGGNNETGAKNMGMLQYGEDIILIDCGVQFADPDMLGVNYSIPDVSFLTKYKKNIKGFLITHAHLDHIGSLKHVYPALGCPPLYGTRFTLWLIRKQLEEARLLSQATLIEVDASKEEKMKIGQFGVEFFEVNHSVPDCAGIYVETPGGTKVVHTGDFKIDHTPKLDRPADLERMTKIGDRGISVLMSDSTGSPKKWHSMSEKNVGEELENIVANHKEGRLIIAMFSSWISRVQQLIDIAEKYDKVLFLSGRSMIDNVEIAKELGYLSHKKGVLKKMSPKNTKGIPFEKQIIITTGSQGEQFSALARMSEGRHNAVEIITGDTVVFSSSVVPGNEKSVIGIINKLIKLGVNVITKDDGEVHTGGHAFQDEQIQMIEMMRPKYFMPIFGDLYFRHIHKNTAKSLGYKEENCLMLDNGNIVDFAPNNGNVFRSKIKAPIQEIIIDGNGMGLATSHVLKAREKMMNSGVLVVLFKIDKKTKAIFGHIKLESRGLVYLDEVRYIHKAIIKKARESYENTVKDVPDLEESDLIKVIRADLEKFLLQKIDREPMIIPMIVEI